MSGVNEIRKSFLDYFAREGHAAVPSGPLVPRNDPTLMFTSAGMVQFKTLFTGVERRAYSTATTAQKCLRAGGKHNDLDNVGYTARHHTFFEMLGNFSFGDYFKDRAIELAWRLVTKEFGLPKDRLLVTIYVDDDEAHGLWKKIAGLSDDRIIRIASSDNFWAAGDTGPCGPCSEIFYDQGDALFGGPPGSADEDGDRFLEFWNLVFMQYDQVAPGDRRPLPRPSIDTGMGLERISAILQGVPSNYDTDLFRALIAAAVEATGVPAEGEAKASHRVIADHLRASSFLVAEGVLPGNEGRGYVLRRIMRRAMRHAQLIGAKDPLMHRLVPALVREMGGAYPELVRAESLIEETLELEETRFRQTLARGLGLLDEASAGLGEGDRLAGETAFKLYDTYGFPLDLTEDALRSRGVAVDTEGFNAAMARQKAEARAAWAGSGEAATETVWFAIRDRAGPTEFLGYAEEAASGAVAALVRDGAEVDRLEAGESGLIVMNQTPFYAESGGQVGDHGAMSAPGVAIEVTDVQKKLGDLFVHSVTVREGAVAVGDALSLAVDPGRRGAVRGNHSATHLLHEALRLTLGDHIAQKGSLVAPDRLRFDFSHPKPISDADLAEVERLANAVVLSDDPVVTRVMPVADAMKSGARALFGEKYGDEVRVVSMGRAAKGGDTAFSVELCGGTHVRATGEVGPITIVGESGVASGVRRIEALSGEAARLHLEAQNARVADIAAILKSPEAEVVARVETLVEERKRLERDLAEARKRLAMGGGTGAADDARRQVAGVTLFARTVEGVEMKDLKGLVDEAKRSIGSGVAAIVGVTAEGKAGVVVGVTQDLTQKFNAVELVRAASAALGGTGGGGRPDMAQAGGPDGAKASEALDAVAALLSAA
jgi:alanyl-tRNA synthetase